MFRALKQAFDPANLLNPGVKLPAASGQRPEGPSPISRLKVGVSAAPLPDDIAAILRDIERTGSWDRDRLSFADSPSARPPSAVLSPSMSQYLDLLRHILRPRRRKADRTGTGTLQRLRLPDALRPGRRASRCSRPKSSISRSIIHELLWFLPGETNVRSLQADGVTIWDEWADADGELGPVYGYQWRSWPDAGRPPHRPDRPGRRGRSGRNPDSRRQHRERLERGGHSRTWRSPPATPCSSSTWPTAGSPASSTSGAPTSSSGVPFNIASYALLTMMVAQVTGLAPGRLRPHAGRRPPLPQPPRAGATQLAREPRPLPRMSSIRRSPGSRTSATRT